MKISRRILMIFACALLAMGTVAAAGPVWETIQTVTASPSSEPIKVDIAVRDGYIYVTTNKATTVKLLSIVGQTISSQNIQAGISRIKVPARGIYILKAGDTTLRVTI